MPDSDKTDRFNTASAKTIDEIPVRISYEIIRLFSEGLYQSPHKAVEELVSNGYDAGAREVHVLLPEGGEAESDTLPPLWVIDDGHGMDADGFRQLWRVADSNKAEVQEHAGRPPIGQFGIGKLAAYVLAWRLDHVSRTAGTILRTSMNFRNVTGHQFEDAQPVMLELEELSEAKGRELLADVESRDPEAWDTMFGSKRAETWTAAGLSDFKNLYDKLSAGTLRWVLRTGLPMHSEFRIWVNGEELSSSKESYKEILRVQVGSPEDTAADKDPVARIEEGGVEIPGIEGTITGTAQIFEKRLTEGKSDQYSRSNGFFIRVRGRVINLEDELFGLDAVNHAAWSRFSMEVDADGLREYLLSSREGVRETEATRAFRTYLLGVFNICRNAYEVWLDRQTAGLDIQQLLSDAPSLAVVEPLLRGVRDTLQTDTESFYVSLPQLGEEDNQEDWLEAYEQAITESPFKEVVFEDTGPFDRALRYVPETRTLMINTEHPFIEKLISNGKNRGAATLFGSSELLMDVLLTDHGIPRGAILDLLGDRDRILRLLAGQQPSTAAQVLRRLKVANQDETALERAVGEAFRVLGFEYERRGGSQPGPDGILYARLGRGETEKVSDYRVVYDAKQTNKPAVPADKINISSLNDFKKQEKADFAFFIADAYEGDRAEASKLNRMVLDEATGDPARPVSVLKLDHLRRIVELHYRYGVPLTRVRSLFETAHTVPEVEEWVRRLEVELSQLEPRVPLRVLLEGLEKAKHDAKARPNVQSVRYLREELKGYTPEKLRTALQAVETIIGKRWLEVETSGEVKLHHNAEQILAEVERNLQDIFGSGVNPADRQPIS